MKYFILSIIIVFSVSAHANNPEYLRNLPTTFQEVNYSLKTLRTYLEPMGYELINDSLNINEGIALSGLGSLTYVRTSEFIIKNISFMVKEKGSEKILGGSIYLAIVSKNAHKKLNIEAFNSSAIKLSSISKFGEDQFYLMLSRGFSGDSLSIDISPLDFKLF